MAASGKGFFRRGKLEDSVCLDVVLFRCDAWNCSSPLVTIRGVSLGAKIIY